VQQYQHNVAVGQANSAKAKATPAELASLAIKKAKAEAEKAALEFKALQRASIKQKPLEPGVDPKSVVCEFFKAGVCEKGLKCKYSHDLTMSKKAAKVDLYSDRRVGEEADGGIANWDQAKLEAAVASKHGAEAAGGGAAAAAGGAGQAAAGGGGGGGAAVAAHTARPTDIVCKFFLEAIEREQYGWFWTCPNGGDSCKYRHALPPGFVFKTRKERAAEAAAKLEGEAEEVDIGELIEAERAKLPAAGLTPVTAATFAAWKLARDARKAAEAKASADEIVKRAGGAGGAEGGRFKLMSGRALFAYKPELFVDDDEADDEAYSQHSDEVAEGEGEGEGEGGAEGAGAAAGGEGSAEGGDGDGGEDEEGEEDEDGEGEGEEDEGEDEEEDEGEAEGEEGGGGGSNAAAGGSLLAAAIAGGGGGGAMPPPLPASAAGAAAAGAGAAVAAAPPAAPAAKR
jgi:hypothetical protein